jgi:hypothetical protein
MQFSDGESSRIVDRDVEILLPEAGAPPGLRAGRGSDGRRP